MTISSRSPVSKRDPSASASAARTSPVVPVLPHVLGTKATAQVPVRHFVNPKLYDLRDRAICAPNERAQDCAPIFTHPATVITVFVLGMLLLGAGLWFMINYSLGRTRSITQLWRISVAIFLLITILGLIVPYRLRFSTGNLYGLLTIALLLEYAVFICAFPVQTPSDEHVEAVEFIRQFMKQEKEKQSLKSVSQ
jgi:hypothetical protein